MARGDQLGRQWRIIQTLISSQVGKTAVELSDECECHSRTVYRDLEALQIAGFPICTTRVDGKKLWSVLDTVKQHVPIPFSMTELMALYFSRDMLKILRNTVFYDSLESLFQKIKTTIPPESEHFLENLQQTLYVSQKHYKEYGKFKETINVVNSAAINKKSVEMTYFTMSSRKESSRKVDPYRIWFFNGTFYLIGFCHLRKDIRIFALDRIKNIHTTEDNFTVPEDFDLDDLMKSSFGIFQGKPENVKIKFDSDIAGYIEEKIWHESQIITRQANGSIIFEAETAVTRELMFWILSWGADAEVIEPQTLKENIMREAHSLLKKYDNKL
jgi:predicted DNA-binding transcriptional regulator YafY